MITPEILAQLPLQAQRSILVHDMNVLRWKKPQERIVKTEVHRVKYWNFRKAN